MPRGQRDGHSTLAKSLPVTVPAFPSIVRRAVQDQNDDQVKFYKIFNFCNIRYTISAFFFSCLFNWNLSIILIIIIVYIIIIIIKKLYICVCKITVANWSIRSTQYSSFD